MLKEQNWVQLKAHHLAVMKALKKDLLWVVQTVVKSGHLKDN
jgi:hypothetical protein